LIGNVPREDESSWTSTIVDLKIFKWSPNAVQWPICLEQDYNRIANNISLYPYMQCTNIGTDLLEGKFYFLKKKQMNFFFSKTLLYRYTW
jgi:hypothetical protein